MERAVRMFTLLSPGKTWGRGLIAALVVLLLAYLLLFLILPVASLLVQGVRDSGGALGLEFVILLLANPLYAEGLVNSLLAGAGSALLAGALALPVAGLLWRCNVRPAPFLELCGFLPLFVPPFVLAASLQAVLGRGGGLGFLDALLQALQPENGKSGSPAQEQDVGHGLPGKEQRKENLLENKEKAGL